jgi:hypothetical protein
VIWPIQPPATLGTPDANHNRIDQLPTVTAPTAQLLEWIAERSRSYAETIEVWRTSCPRLAVWEDALADDLVRVDRGSVLLTPAGQDLLETPPR